MKSGNAPKKWECSVSSGNDHPSTAHHEFSGRSRRQPIHTPHKEKENHKRRAGASKGGPLSQPVRAERPPASAHPGRCKAMQPVRADDQSTLHNTSIPMPFLSCSFKKTWCKVGNPKGFPRRRANVGSSCLLILFMKNRKGKGTVGNHGRREADARVIHRLRVRK